MLVIFDDVQVHFKTVQEPFCFLRFHGGQLLHGLGRRFRTQADDHEYLGAIHHFHAGLGVLIQDLTFFVLFRVFAALTLDLDSLVLAKLIVVFTQQLGNTHHIVLIGESAGGNEHQRDDQRHQNHRCAGKNGYGHNAVVSGRRLRLFGFGGSLSAPRRIRILLDRCPLRNGLRLRLRRRCGFDRNHFGAAVRCRSRGRRRHHFRGLAEFIHIIEHCCGCGIPVLGIQGHCSHDDLFQPLRDVGIDSGGQYRSAIDMLDGNPHRRLSIVRHPSGNHLIHHNAQRVDIGTVIHSASLGLLGRNVVNRTQRFFGQRIALGHDPGNAKVSHLYRAVLQHHHIMGLNITVDQSTTVGMLQRLADLDGKVQRFLPVQVATLFHILLQRDAIDQLHDDEIRLVGAGNIINRNNIGMTQHSNGLSLRAKTAAEFFILNIIVFQDLNGHQTVQTVAASLIHHCHATGADDLKYFITAV